MAPRKAYLKDGTLVSHPVSTGKVRKQIVEMLRKCGVPPDKAFGNNGLLDEGDIQQVRKYLSKSPNSGIKLIFQ